LLDGLLYKVCIEEVFTELQKGKDDAVRRDITVSFAAFVFTTVGFVKFDDGVDYIRDEQFEEPREAG
jgi:hypothetical protein